MLSSPRSVESFHAFLTVSAFSFLLAFFAAPFMEFFALWQEGWSDVYGEKYQFLLRKHFRVLFFPCQSVQNWVVLSYLPEVFRDSFLYRRLNLVRPPWYCIFLSINASSGLLTSTCVSALLKCSQNQLFTRFIISHWEKWHERADRYTEDQ